MRDLLFSSTNMAAMTSREKPLFLKGTRLPPMWPGFDSQTRRHMWVEFVGSLLCTERFSPGTPVSPFLKNQQFDLICVNR